MSEMTSGLVERMTPTQIRVILSLPDDGSFGPADTHQCAKRMWYGVGRSEKRHVIHHQTGTGNSWCLNRLGMMCAAALRARVPLPAPPAKDTI